VGADDVSLRDRAEALRTKFVDTFWLPERGWYAIALDADKRPVDALTSNVGHGLWTGIATDEHAAVMVERLSGAEMDSGFGLRTLATTMGAYNPMSYHNGSIWPHDTAIAVTGLLRYRHLPGAVALAERLALGLLDAAEAFGGRLPELYCGLARSQFSSPVPYPTSCSPQAWASAARLLLLRSFLGLDPHVPHKKLTVCHATADGVGQGHPDRSAARRHHGAFRSRGRESEDPRRARRLATADAGLLMLMCH
jgi:glycogen debranching enzyme